MFGQSLRICIDIEAIGPDPLRPVVVTEPVGHFQVGGIIVFIIVWNGTYSEPIVATPIELSLISSFFNIFRYFRDVQV